MFAIFKIIKLFFFLLFDHFIQYLKNIKLNLQKIDVFENFEIKNNDKLKREISYRFLVV